MLRLQIPISVVLMLLVVYVKPWAIGLFRLHCRFLVVKLVSPGKEVGSFVQAASGRAPGGAPWPDGLRPGMPLSWSCLS